MPTCTNNQYIKMNFDEDPPTGSCEKCPDLPPEIIQQLNDGSTTLDEYFRKKSKIDGDTYGPLINSHVQCGNYQTYTKADAASEKEAVNLSGDTIDTGNWEILDNVDSAYNIEENCESGNPYQKETNIRICEIINFYINSEGYLLTNEYDTNPLEKQINNQFGKLNAAGDFVLPDLPEKFGANNKGTMENYKKAIHEGRGKYIKNNERIIEYLNNSFVTKETLPSKDNIIIEEIYDFWIELNRHKKEEPMGLDILTMENIFSGRSSSTEFEICMNNLFDDRLHTNKDYDHDIQEKISNHKSITKLTNKELNYIEDKLKIIAILEPEDAMECMNILNIGQTYCDKGISDRMLNMGYLVFHIIGLDNMGLDTIKNGSHDYHKLTAILDRLTPYIRRAVKKIIDISKHYELKNCGNISVQTHVMETVYNDIFEKKEEMEIHIDSLKYIPESLIRDTTTLEFAKTIILLIVSIAGIYVLLMILNRPPYPS